MWGHSKCVTLHLLWNIKEDILKNAGNTVLVPVDFYYGQKKTHWDISQNIFFDVPQKQKSHTGLEWHYGE